MTDPKRRIPPPSDLQADGGELLWRNVTREFVLNSAESALLYRSGRHDRRDRQLKAALNDSMPIVRGSKGQPRPNGLLAELRQHRRLADQLVVALAVPVEGEVVGRRRSAAARTVAQTRWR